MTPHAGRLVSWTRAWRAGLVPYDDALDAIATPAGDDEIADLPEARHPLPLGDGLSQLSHLRPDEIRLVLPAPGDPRGLPGPGPLTAAALAAGEVAICGRLGLVPEVTRRVSGSGDEWLTIRWRSHPVPFDPIGWPAPGIPDPLTVAEAEHDLLMALRESTDVLRDLEVAAARPETTHAVDALRRNRPGQLPPGYDARAQRLLDRASMVSATFDLAAADGGMAPTVHLMRARAAALRPLATTARRAMVAAYNAPLR